MGTASYETKYKLTHPSRYLYGGYAIEIDSMLFAIETSYCTSAQKEKHSSLSYPPK